LARTTKRLQTPAVVKGERRQCCGFGRGGTIDNLTNKCGAYRNLLYFLMDQDQTPHVIDAVVTVAESFPANEMTGDSIPSLTGSASTTEEGYLQDINGLIANAGSCTNAPAFSGTEKQHFSVTIGGVRYDRPSPQVGMTALISTILFSANAVVTKTITADPPASRYTRLRLNQMSSQFDQVEREDPILPRLRS
jgi:hypothetical protein